MARRLGLFILSTLATACGGRSTPPAPPAPAPRAATRTAADPTTLRYVAGSGRYHVESQTHVVQDVMGQQIEQDITSSALLSAEFAVQDGNLGVAITIDSLALNMPGASPTDVQAARGRTLRFVFSPSGQLVSAAPFEASNQTLEQIRQGLRDFLPDLPTVPITAGATWQDTVTQTTPTQGLMVSTRAARVHRLIGWEDRGGVRALKVTTTSTYTVSGSGEVQGQSLELEGSGQSMTDAYVSAAGVFLGITQSDSALVNANVVNVGIVVPVRRTTRSSVTRLP